MVGERLVEEQQPGPADQGVGDEDALLLTSGEVAHPGVGEVPRVDGVEHGVDGLTAPSPTQGHAEPVPVEAQGHDVAGTERHVGVEEDLLGNVADDRVAPGERPATHQNAPGAGRLKTEDDPEEGGLARPVGADQTGELARHDPEADVVEHLSPGQPDADPVDVQDRVAGTRVGGGDVHSRVVETPPDSACSTARASAAIHDW
jgi:hypothetical protein